MNHNQLLCSYCASQNLEILYKNQFHNMAKNFGPFNIFECKACGSSCTENPPTLDRLSDFYREYDLYRPQWYNKALADSALNAQYLYYAKFISKNLLNRTSCHWLEIGSGQGEVAKNIQNITTGCQGTAIDIGPRPTLLPQSVSYKSIDINSTNWASSLQMKYDFVFSVAVWEHVLNPKDFAKESLKLVAPGGSMVHIAPDFGSLARKILNRQWPYILPGEHLHIPSKRGARLAIEAAAKELGIDSDNLAIKTGTLFVGYSLNYVLKVLRFDKIAALVPPNISLPMPTGIQFTQVHLIK